MPPLAFRLLVLALSLVLAGCASRPLPKYEKPLARAQFQTVRTTAYTHTEGDHLQYANRNACGDCLSSGAVKSAACDWSRWPVGTMFRIQETGELYVVDDYGWALSGTNTIDLYKPTRTAMNQWGVRRVHIETVKWGDVRRSLAILRPRTKHRHVRRMVDEIEDRYAELNRPMEMQGNTAVAVVGPAAAPAPAAVAAAAPVVIPVAQRVIPVPANRSGAALTPFLSSAQR